MGSLGKKGMTQCPTDAEISNGYYLARDENEGRTENRNPNSKPATPLLPRPSPLSLLPFLISMAKKISWFLKLKQDALALWDEGFRPDTEPSRLHRFLHFWVLVGKSFVRNRCPLRASALSYTTLLALIPMLAVAMSVTTSLLKKEGKDQIESFIESFVSKMIPPAGDETNSPPVKVVSLTNQPPAETQSSATYSLELATNAVADTSTNNAIAGAPPETNRVSTAANEEKKSDATASRLSAAQKKVADQIYGFVQNVQSGAIAGVGMLFVVWAAIRMLSQIENTFNDIWGVTRGRSWWMSIVLYWTTITLGPLLLVGAVGLASGPHLQSTQKFLLHMPGVGALIFKLLPLVLLWLAFSLFYKAVPNTKVRLNAALIGGFVAGSAWHINNMLAFLYVSRVVTYSKMYGALALIPVFMLGMYLSWIILLFGAQVAYAYQNRALYLQERIAENVNQRGREFVALRLMTCIGQRFQRGLAPPSSQEMSDELCIPSRLVQQVLQTLIAAHLVIEVSGLEPAYTPGRPLEQINAHHVLQALRARGQELLTRNEPVREEVYGEFARIQAAEKLAASSITMLALVHRAEARLELNPPAPEIEPLPELVPAVKPAATPEPATQQSVEVPKPEPETIAETAKSPSVPETKAPRTRAITEPAPDDEREFPL